MESKPRQSTSELKGFEARLLRDGQMSILRNSIFKFGDLSLAA